MNNNIFEFATGELTQDAFICWCVNWFNDDSKPKLKELSIELARLFTATEKIETIKISRQFSKDVYIDDKKLALGYVIIDSNKRNMGYGKQMIKLSLKFAFEEYGASEVSLDVFDSNKQAYNCYKSIGFVETGKQEHIIIGEYTWNYIEMMIKSNK